MRHIPSRWRLVVAIGIILVLLSGCKRTPSPTPPPPPDTPSPDAWVEHETARVRISLPAGWEAPAVTPEALHERFAAFQFANPELAKGLASDETSFQQIHFWGFGDEDAGFVDSLVILAAATPGEEIDVAQVVTDVAAQHHAKGYTLRAQEADLEIAGHPASQIIYAYDMTDSNQAVVTVEAHQYFVASEDTLWILTYTLRADRSAELTPIVARSALSFRLR